MTSPTSGNRSPLWIVILFGIKICGVTNPKDGQIAALAGADAVGLNFYDQSSRFVDEEAAEKIAKVLPAKVQRVGVFVNTSVEEVNRISETLSLNFIQLHGDQPPEFLSDLIDLPIICAFRYAEEEAGKIADYLAACSRPASGVLIDAKKEGEFGGTGEVLDWAALARSKEILGNIPLILAGGLTPFNVEEAVATVRPVAVDCASGVESKPGMKDPMLLRAFVNAAKRALQALQSGESE